MATSSAPLAIVTAIVLGASAAILVNTPAPASPPASPLTIDSTSLEDLVTIGI